MSSVTFDPVTFRLLYPQFANATTFPDVLLNARFDLAGAYVSPDDYGDMSLPVRTQALGLMTAHLMAIGVLITQNNYQGQVGVVVGAQVDHVQISLSPPPHGTSQWRWWLNTTPYGAQLVALLEGQAVGGFNVGGLPESAAFRRVGGVFL